MIEFNSHYIPRLTNQLSIIPFDRSNYLICIDDENPRKFKIGSYAKLLLDQIDGSKNISEIASSFNIQSNSNFSESDVINIFKSQFLGFGIFATDTTEKVKLRDNYLRLRFTLFSESLVKKLVHNILFLFDQKVFRILFPFCLIFITIFFILHIRFKELYFTFTSSLGIWFISLYALSHVLHEIGHAGACNKFGAKSGNIGFGFYFLMPVFFADVSDAWRLKKSQRIIVDLAGVYMQLIFCSLFVLIYILNGNRFFLNMSFLITSTMYAHINPFFRFDGYWALSDSLNIPNLRYNSVKSTKQLISRISGKTNTWQLSRLNFFLVIYCILYIVFVAWFLIFMLVFERNAILHFPIDLFNFLYHIVTNFHTLSFDFFKENIFGLFLPFLFYFTLYQYSKRLVPQISIYLKSNLIKRKRTRNKVNDPA